MKHGKLVLLSVLILLLSGVGCDTTSYVVPGEKAELSRLAPSAIQEGFSSEPSDPFPASIVAIRLQGSNYQNYRLQRGAGIYGSGQFSVVTTREVESQSDFEKILNLDGIEQIISLNRMLVPDNMASLQDLREASSKLKADLIFLYTFDTVFFDTNKSQVLSAITLGFSPNKKIRATTTVSGLLVDTRTGYIYSAYEATSAEEKSASAWNSRDTADEARLQTESDAFARLIDEVVASWDGLMLQVDARNSRKMLN